jgi:hypothetical protein
MNEVEKAMAKQEYKRERKKITDGLRFKRNTTMGADMRPREFRAS